MAADDIRASVKPDAERDAVCRCLRTCWSPRSFICGTSRWSICGEGELLCVQRIRKAVYRGAEVRVRVGDDVAGGKAGEAAFWKRLLIAYFLEKRNASYNKMFYNSLWKRK